MNILLPWTDQQRRDTLRVHGNDRGLMPNLDRLAEQCTVFRQAYCAAPLCTPSRGSYLTGTYPHVHGAVHNNDPLRQDIHCLPEHMRACGHAGFRSAYIGKWHLGDELFAQHGFDHWVATEDGYQPHFSPGRDQSLRSPFQQHLVEKGYRPDPNDPWIRDWSMTLPERDSKPAYIVNQAIDFLEDCGDTPWVLSMNCLEPHHPLMGPCADAFGPDDVPDWPTRMYRDPEALMAVRHRQEGQFRNGFEDFHLRDEQSWRQCCAHYWGQCRQVDNQYGRFLDYLKEKGLFDNTLIVFCSDHGDCMGCHSMFGKSVPYEEAVGIPMMIKLPGQTEGKVIDGPISNTDILPTLCELIGLPPIGQGRSLASALDTGTLPEKDVLVVWDPIPPKADKTFPDWTRQLGSEEEVRSGLSTSWRMLVTPEGWKVLRAENGETWITHLVDDPHEKHNQAATIDPQLRHDLFQRLAAKLREVEDPLAGPLG